MSDQNAEETLVEVDRVYQMLESLTSKDADKRAEAEKDIDRYLDEKKKSECKTVTSRTVINAKKTSEEEAKIGQKLAEEFRHEGNEHFLKEEYSRANEYYTSGILQNNQCPLLYSNRAQARIKLGLYSEAVEDCRLAIKLRPHMIKARVHLSKALRGLGRFKEAVETLDEAELISDEAKEAVKKYREEAVEDMKKDMLENAQPLKDEHE